MSEHEKYAEPLALYAMGALTGEDRAKLDEHLASCASCRLELEQLRADTALLALSAAGPRPPQRARLFLLDALAREARVADALSQITRKRETKSHAWPWGPGWWGWLARPVAIIALIPSILSF